MGVGITLNQLSRQVSSKTEDKTPPHINTYIPEEVCEVKEDTRLVTAVEISGMFAGLFRVINSCWKINEDNLVIGVSVGPAPTPLWMRGDS